MLAAWFQLGAGCGLLLTPSLLAFSAALQTARLNATPCPSSLALQLQRLVAGASDGPAAVQLLDELMAVAMERCLEPLLLELAVLDRILAQSAAAARQQGGGGGAPQASLL